MSKYIVTANGKTGDVSGAYASSTSDPMASVRLARPGLIINATRLQSGKFAKDVQLCYN
jgi:hypothetical protein